MKEKRNYKRFELIPFLAIVGCVGMFLFEGYFILERYNREVGPPESPVPVAEKPASPVSVGIPAVSVPAAAAPAVEAKPGPAEIEAAPASRAPAEPAAVPVG